MVADRARRTIQKSAQSGPHPSSFKARHCSQSTGSAPQLLRQGREETASIALAVALQTVRNGVPPPASEGELKEAIRLTRWVSGLFHFSGVKWRLA
jgi:hypothetical protein